MAIKRSNLTKSKIHSSLKDLGNNIEDDIIHNDDSKELELDNIEHLYQKSPYKKFEYKPTFEGEPIKINLKHKSNFKLNKVHTGSLIKRDIISGARTVSKKFSALPLSITLFLLYTFVSGLWYLIWGYFLKNNLVLNAFFMGNFGIFLNFVFFLLSLFLIYGLMENEDWNYIFAGSWYLIHILNFIFILINAFNGKKLMFGEFTIPFSISLILINVVLAFFIIKQKDFFRYNIPTGGSNNSPWTILSLILIICVIFILFTVNVKLSEIDNDMSSHYVDLKPMNNNILLIKDQMDFCFLSKDSDMCYLTLKNIINSDEYQSELNLDYEKFTQAKTDSICLEVKSKKLNFLCNNYQFI